MAKLTTTLKNEAIAIAIAAGSGLDEQGRAKAESKQYFVSEKIIDGKRVTCAIYYGFMGKNKVFNIAGEVMFKVDGTRIAAAKLDAMFS